MPVGKPSSGAALLLVHIIIDRNREGYMPADRHRCATENITTSGYITYSNDKVIRISGWLKLIDLGYRSSLSVAWMIRFWFKSFQNSTVHKRPLVQGSLFLLAVISIKCLSICAPSFATVVRCDCGALRVIARLKRRPRPELYLVTINHRHYTGGHVLVQHKKMNTK